MAIERTRRIFVSDIHLSSTKAYRSRKYPSWYRPSRHEARLLAFLDQSILKQSTKIKDLVLLGDIFNTWVWPANEAPPSYGEIFTANKHIFAKFEAIISAGINVFFINGNHDFDLTPNAIQAEVSGIQPVKCYRSGLIYAEHGNQYDIYNKLDFISDPAGGRPIGHFITRLMTSCGDSEFNLLDLPGTIDDILEAALTPQNIFSSIIEALAEKAGMSGDDEILLPDDKRVTINDLKERYKKLNGVYNLNELISDLYQRRYLHGPADRLCQKYDYRIVVFGHTHNALIDKDFFLVKDRIYANTGSFCKDNAYCVEIDKSSDPKSPIKVSLNKVESTGEMNLVDEQEINVSEEQEKRVSKKPKRPKRR
jgi:UDP-2,3-diacylglucosamine pyrophosphatase LpxH